MAVLAVPFVFMFPQLTLLLFALGLASLPFAIIFSRLLGYIQRRTALLVLRSDSCPACGKRMQSSRAADLAWTCEFCESTFQPDGVEEREETGTARSVTDGPAAVPVIQT